MAHVCPWWRGYLLAHPLRTLVQDPREILSPYVTPGMTVLEPGPGRGFFTVELARLVGEKGKVVAVDLQPRMLAGVRKRATKAGLAGRVETRQAGETSLGIDDLAGKADFALVFALLHEVPDQQRFLSQVACALAPGRKALLSEPTGHVSKPSFLASLEIAARCGLALESEPRIWRSLSALLVRR